MDCDVRFFASMTYSMDMRLAAIHYTIIIQTNYQPTRKPKKFTVDYYCRATMCAEDRARFFPGPNGSTPITTTEDTKTSSPTSTEEDRASPPTPMATEEEKASPPTPTEDQTRTSLPTPPTVTGFNNLWNVALSEDVSKFGWRVVDKRSLQSPILLIFWWVCCQLKK